VRAGGGMSRLSRPEAAPEEAVLAFPAGDAALTAAVLVLIFRLATYWLPVLPGWLSWRLLQRTNYV
jgi:hypothetical protein